MKPRRLSEHTYNMATYYKKDQNLSYDIPNEGELFQDKSNPGWLYKRVGSDIFHTQAPGEFDTSALKSYNFGDLSSTNLFNATADHKVGAGAFYKDFSTNFFANNPTTTADVNVAEDPNLKSLIASGGAGVGGFQAGGQTLTSPTVLSSEGGAQAVQKGSEAITNLEKSLIIQSGDTLSQLALNQGTTVEELMKANPDIKDPNLIYAGNKLNIPVTTPASAKMLSDINQAISGGNLTADQQKGLNNLQATGDAITAATAGARAALEKKDYAGMDTFVEQANQSKAALEKQLADYFTSTSALRQKKMDLMSPTAREAELKKKLLEVRTAAEQFRIQTDKDKMSEYEGQTLGFSHGRAAEIDFKASFRNQEMAAAEKNLLLELGLEQEAREMADKTIEEQITNLGSDFELQGKVQDRIDKITTDVIERADKLTDEAKDSLSDFVESFDGMSFEDLSPESQEQLKGLAESAGLDINLVKDALKAQKAQRIFENSTKNSNSSANKEKVRKDEYAAAQEVAGSESNANITDAELEAAIRSRATELSDSDIKSIVAERTAKKKYITSDWIMEQADEKILKDSAYREGFTTGGFLGFGVGDEGVQDFLEDLMIKVEKWRSEGKTDKQIEDDELPKYLK